GGLARSVDGRGAGRRSQVGRTASNGHEPHTSDRFDARLVAGLPEPVSRYFAHALADGAPLITEVHVAWSGASRSAHGWISRPSSGSRAMSSSGGRLPAEPQIA